MGTGNFKVMKASAGSGKTYALVREFLSLVLATDKPDYYRHILAITFTNAAAAEMKERVLARLHDFADGGAPELVAELSGELGMDEMVVRKRAGAAYRHMLHHYGMLSISTIDSFTHRLVRSFARDLHLSHDFAVQMDTTDFIREVVDACLDSIGSDEDLTAYLRQFAIDNLEDETSWNIRHALEDFVKLVLREEARIPLSRLAELSLTDFKRIRKNLFQKIRSYETGLQKLASDALKWVETHGVSETDFWYSGSGSISLLKKISDGHLEAPGKRTYDFLKRDEWHKDKIAGNLKDAIALIRPTLLEYFNRLLDGLQPTALAAYELKKKVLANIYVLGLMNKLHALSRQLKQEQNILLIQDFHELIHEVVRDNDAPFIYERIGNRYRHILFDEFQDTSELQWGNAIPLIQNALGEGHLNLIVGDGKQSIYRWRGGRAEQFVDLPVVHITGIHQQASYMFGAQYQPVMLTQNYRSAQAIIEFNNSLYTKLAQLIPSAGKVYEGHEQEKVRAARGFVHISRVDGTNKEDRWPLTATEILASVRSSIEAGYIPRDIAILTRRGASEAGIIAAMLSSHGYEVETRESFLLSHSPRARAVMACLTYLVNEENHFAVVEAVKALCEMDPARHLGDFVTNYTKRENKRLVLDFRGWLRKFLEGELPSLQEGIYSCACSLLLYLGLSTDTYVEFLLDHIRQRTITGNDTLGQLVEWWEKNRDKTYISSSPNPHAVRIMTIHKSKGLQFPVVIYPRMAASDIQNNLWIETDEAELGLPTALVKGKSVSEEDASLWPAEFHEETKRKAIDDLNLSYVATTRAEERLYIIVENGSRTEVSRALDEVLTGHFSDHRRGASEWVFGEETDTDGRPTMSGSAIIHHTVRAGNDFQVRSSGPPSEQLRAGLDYGILLHNAFSFIRTAADMDAAINRASRILGLPAPAGKKLRAGLEGVVYHPDWKYLFEGFQDVLLERELFSATGKVLRPDRVVVFEDRVVVVDFKTGVRRSAHDTQLKEYADALKLIYPLKVLAHVIYIGDEPPGA